MGSVGRLAGCRATLLAGAVASAAGNPGTGTEVSAEPQLRLSYHSDRDLLRSDYLSL
jgi:hypothetical protein